MFQIQDRQPHIIEIIPYIRDIYCMNGAIGHHLHYGAFHVKIFHFSIAYYVKELGAYPGSKPLQNLTFESAFKW